MPKIVGYVGETPPTGEQSFPWLPTLAVFASAYGMLWIASRLSSRLVANAPAEFAPATLMKIREATRRARAGEAKIAPPAEIIKELSQLPPGRYTFDLDPEFPSRRRKYSRNRYRRYKNSTTMRGAFLSASRAADGSDSRHVLVDTMGEPTGDPASPYNAADPVVLGIYREDGEPVFLIHADSLTPPPELSKEARETRRDEKKAEREARKERRAERAATQQTRSEKAAEKREQRRLEREERERAKEEARIARAEASTSKILAKAQEAAAKAAEQIRQATAEAKAAGVPAPAPATAPPSRTSRKKAGPAPAAAPAPAPVPAPAPAPGPTDEERARAKAEAEDKKKRLTEALKRREATKAELQAEQQAEREETRRLREMTPEQVDAYLAAKKEAAAAQAPTREQQAEAAAVKEAEQRAKAIAALVKWFNERVTAAQKKGIIFPDGTIEGTVTKLSKGSAYIDYGAEVILQPSAPLTEEGITVGDRIRISVVTEGGEPAGLAVEKIEALQAAEPEPAPAPEGKPTSKRTSKKKAAQEEPEAEVATPTRALTAGRYIYLGESGGSARAIDYFGSVEVADAAPFISAGAQANTLVEVVRDPEGEEPFLVIEPASDSQPSSWQAERLESILKRTQKSAKESKTSRSPKKKVSKAKAKEREFVPDEEAATTFSEAGAEGDIEEFIEPEEETSRQPERVREEVYRTVAVSGLPAEALRAVAARLLKQVPDDTKQVAADGTVRVVGEVVNVPGPSKQKSREGFFRFTFGDFEIKPAAGALQVSDLLEVGDQVVVTARGKGGAVSEAFIEFQRLGRATTPEERAAVRAAKKASREAEPQAASAPVTASAIAASAVPATQEERELSALISKGWIAQRMENLQKHLARTGKSVEDMPNVDLAPFMFAMEGRIVQLPTSIEMQYGRGTARIDWGFESASLPLALLKRFGAAADQASVGDLVRVVTMLTNGVPRSVRIELTKSATEAPKEESPVATKTPKTSKGRGKSSAKLKKNSRASEQDPALYKEFKRTINMSASEIERWRKNPQHRDASFPHIRAELPLLAEMKRTPMSKWTPKMWNKAMRAVNFVKRHEAQMKVQAKRYGTGRLHATYKRIIGLLNWGRKTPGVNIKKVLEGKTSKRVQPNVRVMRPQRFAAGMIVFAQSTGRMLLLLRSQRVSEPLTWDIPGGMCNSGAVDEPLLQCAIREFAEETQSPYEPRGPLSPFFVLNRSDLSYSTFIGYVPHEFEAELDWEHEGYGWFSLDSLPMPLHYGVQSVLEHAGYELARMQPKR
jgi:colicin import membrane protein